MELLTDDRDGARAAVSVDDEALARVIPRGAVHELGAQTLSLWLVDAAHADASLVGSSHLDRHELARAAALPGPGQRARYVLAHGALRVLLGRSLDLAPGDVVYRREPCPRCGGPNGRPGLERPPRPVYFSLSTSGDLILIGIATAPVGVDIEIAARTDSVRDVGALLHRAERADLLAVAALDRAAVFTRLWTRKEAYLKGVGVGVGHGLATPYVGCGPRPVAPSGWSLLDVDVPHPYAAAAAVATDPSRARP